MSARCALQEVTSAQLDPLRILAHHAMKVRYQKQKLRSVLIAGQASMQTLPKMPASRV
jgi:hypothetical protein